ncbi:hypothetical protein DFP98_114105 [Cohnella phaseoli]|uniref:Uncharacterized protein n=1 Tax=Cohnella phaseoli TaxID=456490 RepID=A0A3D9JP02_9BACL|nr:hypothetical protein DFP98_114105 [Cohnella phaseoli]
MLVMTNLPTPLINNQKGESTNEKVYYFDNLSNLSLY